VVLYLVRLSALGEARVCSASKCPNVANWYARIHRGEPFHRAELGPGDSGGGEGDGLAKALPIEGSTP
jgi:hypothetical protein